MSDNKTQPVRGTKDLFGDEILALNNIIEVAKNNAFSYGFQELQTPIFEFSEIFERNLGETSDIVSKEVYKFKDRGDNFLTLRPEFTASIVRAFISNGVLQQNLPQKFFSYGPVFRYDRPQKGRQRQFNQINFEVLGEESELLDVEILLLSVAILKDLGILPKVELQLNSLGCAKTKTDYENALRDYFEKFIDDLSQDSKNRLVKNPLRILDSKDSRDVEICKNAPKISDFYSQEAAQRFAKILAKLDELKVDYVVNSRLVRGLDYYTSLVFEFVMEVDSAQNTVLAGGRYDNLIEKMSGKKCPAIGFAAGVERLMMLSDFAQNDMAKIAVTYISDEQKSAAFNIAQNLRNNGFEVDFAYASSFKKQMKKANQNNSRLVLILGEDEVVKNEITLKDFVNSSEEKIAQDQLLSYLEEKLILS